ncbi:unnamed protein product [Porites lobata]|uniref:Ion transport domain-containing protein n=1 Tax=Porites lobata TaxID=104759 RepID=A0ABN8SAE6_9CNID|nr:unnamed protein product [Porites lobata]
MATWNNDVKAAALCLEKGADVDCLKVGSVTALHMAATKGNLEVADLLISRGADVNKKDGDYKTPLHRAAMFNQLNVIEFLVKKEAKIHARDSEGRSPFLNAVAAGHVDCARVLLKLGADLSAADLHMKNCLHIAVENELLEMLSMLLESRAGVRCLNRRDLKDRVPLHYAAKTRDIKILELVLSKQKHLGFSDESQKTPLHHAAEKASSKHVEVLAKHMSEINARDELGRTPLHSAAMKGQRQEIYSRIFFYFFTVLLSMGAEVDSRDNKFRTPLMWASHGNHTKCAVILLDSKASVDLQDDGSDTALHVACGQGHPAIVKLLLDHGASSALRNKQGLTCLEVAAKAGSCDAAMAIAKHERLADSMCFHVFFDKFSNKLLWLFLFVFVFFLSWKELKQYQISNGQTAISLLVENFPEAAEVVLDQCVRSSDHLNPADPDYTVTYDFKHLDPGPDADMSSGRFSTVQMMIKHKRERLLLHPLTLKFNERKWQSLGRYVFLFDFVTYLLLMVLFTVFIVDDRSDQTFSEPLKQKPSDYYYDEDDPFRGTMSFLILTFSLLHICKELLQIYVQRWNYFKDLSNYLNWALYISSALFMVPYVAKPEDVDKFFASTKAPLVLWNTGVVAIFVCYTNMMLFLRRYRLFGTYISMYIEVTKTVFQVMFVFVFLVLGFALAFFVLFKEQPAFHSVHHSLLRVLVMMIGELDFVTTFIDTIGEKCKGNKNLLNPFPLTGQFFLFLCLFFLTTALMNLLVGLAVGDTKTMKKYATIKRLVMQLEYQFKIEEAYPKNIIRKVYESIHVEKPNKLSRVNRIEEWLHARFAEAAPEPVEEGQTSEFAELKEEILKIKKRIKSMMAMLEALKQAAQEPGSCRRPKI